MTRRYAPIGMRGRVEKLTVPQCKTEKDDIRRLRVAENAASYREGKAAEEAADHHQDHKDPALFAFKVFVLVAGFPFGNMYVFIRSLSYACPGGDGVGNTKSAVGSADGQGPRAGALRGPGPQVLFRSH